jgi:hypothetical protein
VKFPVYHFITTQNYVSNFHPKSIVPRSSGSYLERPKDESAGKEEKAAQVQRRVSEHMAEQVP